MRALILAVALSAVSAATAQAASTTTFLKDRREVSAGTRAYSIGFEDGRFYATGWHITGEMGGIWAPPLKLADGIWFGVDGKWAGPATRFTSGHGVTGVDLPPIDGLEVSRDDFVPDGRRAAMFGLFLANDGDADKTVTVKVDVHSELMTAYPWASTTPSAAANGQDVAAYRNGGTLVFSDGDNHAYVRADRTATGGEIGDSGFRGPQAGTVCHDGDTAPPSACDDGPFGRGAGGELRYRIKIPRKTVRSLWVSVAANERDLDATLRDPVALLNRKVAARDRLAARSRVDLPGDRGLQRAIDWGKQNLADLTQTATNLQIRYTNQGKQFPPPAGSVKSVRFIGAGYPDYPWLFATDGEYTAFAAVALGQFEAISAHLKALQQVSDMVNSGSGKVAHEIVTDGSVYFGANSDNGNTDESVKYASALALVWRWTGDRPLLDDLYPFARQALHYVVDNLDADHDGWPEGLGNVERTGMGEEKLDNAVYLIRGLYDLEAMARATHDATTQSWAATLAKRLRAAFDPTWWDAAASQYADSLADPGDHQVEQQHWIGVTPMEAELPGGPLAPDDHAAAALSVREGDCFSGTPPFNAGLFHTGCTGGPSGKGERIIYSLTTSIAAVAEGNYGRAAQRRYTDANVAGFRDEMPGALPEVLPSPDQSANIVRCWTCRAMFMQAWGNYGTAWPVIHQQLGVRPDIGNGRLDVIPDVPAGQRRISGRAIRLGADGSLAVRATRHSTTVRLSRVPVDRFRIGITLPSAPKHARLDGRRVHPRVQTTSRGVEVSVRAPAHGTHRFSVS